PGWRQSPSCRRRPSWKQSLRSSRLLTSAGGGGSLALSSGSQGGWTTRTVFSLVDHCCRRRKRTDCAARPSCRGYRITDRPQQRPSLKRLLHGLLLPDAVVVEILETHRLQQSERRRIDQRIRFLVRTHIDAPHWALRRMPGVQDVDCVG